MLNILHERPDYQISKPKKNAKIKRQGHPVIALDLGKWLASDGIVVDKFLLSHGYKNRTSKNKTPEKVIARYYKKGHSFIQVR